jgi:hypothetical protein
VVVYGDERYTGVITPTRFVFTTDRLVYPLRITQISVPKQTEALFYVQAPQKTDLPGRWSYQPSWTPMWKQAMDAAYPERLTPQERSWKSVVERELPKLDRGRSAAAEWRPTALEWAKKLSARDIAMVGGGFVADRTDREMTFRQLRTLRGHLREGHWLTKLRRTFPRAEMTDDLALVPAQLGGTPDEMEYVEAMPTSPP